VAPVQDPLLVDSWGLIIIDDVVWVADNGSSVVTTYSLAGEKLPTVVTVNNGDTPGAPTGIVHNFTSGFVIGGHPALWLVATENGTINAYNPLVSITTSSVVVDRSIHGSVYKGIAIAGEFLYATDFHNNKIDVFNSTFALQTNFPFVDPTPLPPGYAPFNIYHVGGQLYVTYALQKPPADMDDLPGLGHGFINIFLPNGNFVRRFASNGFLNSPWGILQAPRSLNLPPGSFLVGNFGDGYINIFDRSGIFLGRLRDCRDYDVNIPGLWGLVGNPHIYFASGPDAENNGLFGKINICCPFNNC